MQTEILFGQKRKNKLPRGRAPRGIKITQISPICREKSVLICEICVKKPKQSFEELNLKRLNRKFTN